MTTKVTIESGTHEVLLAVYENGTYREVRVPPMSEHEEFIHTMKRVEVTEYPGAYFRSEDYKGEMVTDVREGRVIKATGQESWFPYPVTGKEI